MNAGLVGRVHGDFGQIDTSAFPQIRTDRGNTLRSTLEVTERTKNATGTNIILGNAAEQTQSEIDPIDIDQEGNIIQGETTTEVETISTSFASVPGEFVIVESSSSKFAFDLLGRATETMIEPMQFNLSALAADFQEEAEFWMGGFYGHDGSTSNGIAYGDDVFSDQELGNAIWDADKNQLGMDFEYNTENIRLRITESGYVEAHGPDEFGTLSLIRLVNELLMNYEIELEEV